jgi:hypothetical protein
MTIWDGLATPENNAITMRLAHKGDHATWSWIRQSDRKVGIAIEIVGDYFDLTDIPSSKNLDCAVKSFVGLDPMLTIVCSHSDFFEIFEVLCRDLINVSTKFNSKIQVVNSIKNRIAIWHELLKRDYKGLSTNETLGLAAELNFLIFWINRLNGNLFDWLGPEGSPQDFISNNTKLAIEVKVTNWTPSTIKISSLYQLDYKGQLFLVVYPAKISNPEESNSKNLPSLIDNVIDKITGINLELFENKLLTAGYVKNLCQNIHFEISEPLFFNVLNGFPRLISVNVPDGIDSCMYSLQLSKLNLYKTTASEIEGLN